jgi:hypothetical protein
MKELNRLVPQWYTHGQCPFIDTVLLDIVSLCGTSLLRRDCSTDPLSSWAVVASDVGVGPEHVLGLSGGDGDALLREALARLSIVDQIIVRADPSSARAQSFLDALMLLAVDDADTCCAVLDTIDDIVQTCSSSGSMKPTAEVMVLVHQVILQATDAEVLSKAQSVLADALADESTRSAFFAFVQADTTLQTLTHLESQCLAGPPSNMQSALHLFGIFLDHAFHTCPDQRGTVLETAAKYIRLLRVTIIDTNPFDTRFAAAQSLCTLTHIWHATPTSPTTAPLLLALSLLLYDLLNDDDDEIRDLAALATAALLRAQHAPTTTTTTITTTITPTVPLLTTHTLATYLSTAFPDSRALATFALRRLTHTPARTPLFSTPFAHLLAADRTQDNALFATEKQNLYHDSALDAVVWARVLSSLSHAALSTSQRCGLGAWVADALRVLGNTAARESDGALGWATKGEVFALLVGVLAAADVVLRVGEAADQGRMRVALRVFLDRARGAEVHGLVLARGEGVLQKSVVGVLARVGGSLCAGDV